MIVAGSPNVATCRRATSRAASSQPVHERLGPVVDATTTGTVGLGDRVDRRQRQLFLS